MKKSRVKSQTFFIFRIANCRVSYNRSCSHVGELIKLLMHRTIIMHSAFRYRIKVLKYLQANAVKIYSSKNSSTQFVM